MISYIPVPFFRTTTISLYGNKKKQKSNITCDSLNDVSRRSQMYLKPINTL